MKPRGIETVALLAEATLEGLQRLADLPAGTPVGVVGDSQTCMENKSRSIESASLDHLALTETYLDRVDEVRALFERVRAVVCSSATARRLSELGAPDDLEVIEEDRTLDKGGVEMLGRMLRRLPPAATFPGQDPPENRSKHPPRQGELLARLRAAPSCARGPTCSRRARRPPEPPGGTEPQPRLGW